jgi:Flp pilus assembly protein TadD
MGRRASVGRDVPTIPRPALRRASPRRLAVAAGVWAVVTLAAILIAVALDNPVGAGSRDEAQPVAPGGRVAEAPAEGAAGAPAEGAAGAPGAAPASLPPLTLVTDRSLPPEVAGLPPGEAVSALQARAEGGSDPAAWVDLGVALQQLDRPEEAAAAFRGALREDPGHVPALAGLAMAEGDARDRLDAAAAELGRLATAHPDSQLVAANVGWVEFYRRRPEAAHAALERAVALGGDGRVARIARALVEALEQGALGAGP